jgi:hypothetical protein
VEGSGHDLCDVFIFAIVKVSPGEVGQQTLTLPGLMRTSNLSLCP